VLFRSFSAEQIALLNRLVEERKQKSGLYCTACKYCLPVCAVGMEIPDQLDLLNLVRIYGLTDLARRRYDHDLSVKASDCTACGKCVDECPQDIDVPARLREAVLLLDPRAGSVIVRPDVVDLDPVAATFAVRVRYKSLSEQPTDLSVSLRGTDGTRIEPVSFALGEVGGFGQKKKLVRGAFAPGAEQLRLTMELAYQGRVERIDETYTFKALAKGLSDDWTVGTWNELSPKPEDFSSAPETRPLHGARFKLSYDDTGLLLLADVRDDFLRPSNAEADKGQLIDGLEVFLDGRGPARIGRASYEQGVYQIMMYPGMKESSPAFIHCNSPIELSISSERTDAGYRLRAYVPFASFCVRPGVPKKMGFDIGVNTASAGGQRIAQYVWAGTGDNWRNASGFREIWLR
jgi:ferredoxin